MPTLDDEIGLLERLARIQERLGKFNISSGGLVSVVGTLRTGLAVNIDTGPTIVSPGAPPPFVCPTAGTIHITFSGLNLNCSCISGPPTGSAIITDISSNGTFTLIGGPPTWTGNGGLAHLTQWGTLDCSGPPTSDSDVGLFISVNCDSLGWNIEYFFSNLSPFHAEHSTISVNIPDQILCSQIAANGQVGASSGGFASIF